MRLGPRPKACCGRFSVSDWFLKGEPVEQIVVSDRGFQYGDGLFETIAIRNGQARLWQYHMDRLTRGCAVLGIKMPSEAELSSGLEQALRQSQALLAYCVAKIIVSAGTGVRGYGRKMVDSPTILFGIFPAYPPPVESYHEGLAITLCKTRLASSSPVAGLKTLNRLEQVLARSEFVDTGEFEGLTMDADDNIICGTMSNVFFVTNNVISTPSLDRCGVEGVMRRHVIETSKEQGIDTFVQPLHLSQLENIDEVFLSNSQFGVMPVRSCADMRWSVGHTTRRVMSILAENGITECR